MRIRTGIISAITGASLLGGGCVALLVGGGAPAAPAATLLSAPVAATAPAPATATPSTPATSGAPSAACAVSSDDGSWPLYADGRPSGLDAGGAAADYLWHDASGWHLRVTHENDHHQVWSGVLTSTGTFSDLDAVKLEKNDYVTLSADRHALYFRFNNYGGIDGFDFRTHCAPSIHFDLRADGAVVNPTEVIIGHGDHSPAQVPFAIERRG